MDQMALVWWCSLLLGVLPLLLQLVWYWNDLRFVASQKLRAAFTNAHGGRLPPGHMGVPFLGETFTFLWYFKILRRPDGFINSKKERSLRHHHRHRHSFFEFSLILDLYLLITIGMEREWDCTEAISSASPPS